MGFTVFQKLVMPHLVSGKLEKGAEIGLKIDQTLTQDATGTMAYLQFEAMGVERVKTELSVAYIDHNTLQTGFENADDHRYIQTCAKKYGLYFSRPGNGICHQVHLERFGAPGKTLIGSDSHTPTGGGIGMLAFGAGGLDVACAMAGRPYYIVMPEVIKINLRGKLQRHVSAKDIILEILRRVGVKGGVGKVFEYGGEGVSTLDVPERATITNMGAELGATTSIFPSDTVTKRFLALQKREDRFVRIEADPDARYDGEIDLDLSQIVPLAACPHSPDNVKPVRDLAHIKVDQCCVGSCTNSSYKDLTAAASILRGNTVHDDVSLTVSPGSRQVLKLLSQSGALYDLITSGARILESACGPCIGMGQSPKSGGVSLRTFNRNFLGRSGTRDAEVYLVSPETAAFSALKGVISDPRDFAGGVLYANLEEIAPDDGMLVPPASEEEAAGINIERGPNIKPFPKGNALVDDISSTVALVVGDNITTDHIMPAGAKILPYRSNIPHLSKYCFTVCDPDFPERMKKLKSGVVVGGANYGQGSSREHAALVPLHLGVRCVAAKSFARIHRANLINAGIVPLTFQNPDDYDAFALGDKIKIQDIKESIKKGSPVILINESTGYGAVTECRLSEREKDALLAGGLINVRH